MPEARGQKFKKVFMKGHVIFRQDTPGDEMYIIETGKVQVSMQIDNKNSIVLNTFGPKEFFGEMALFGEMKRTASAVALEDTSVMIISSQTMHNQLDKLPSWFVTMFKTLIERLRVTNLKLLPDPFEK